MAPRNFRKRIGMAIGRQRVVSSVRRCRSLYDVMRGRGQHYMRPPATTQASGMTESFQPTTRKARQQTRVVRLWLYAVAAMVAAMVLVGGATRLTESGLSITEWQPVMGVLPPLSQAQWLTEFHRYQQIPQYHELNSGMSLDAFKTIFWWEWSHRLLGRFIGVVFVLPLVWFLWRGGSSADCAARLWLIFGLGALQGAVGWWMVASGLVRPGRGVAISAGDASCARLRHLRSHSLDGAAAWRRATAGAARANSRGGRCAAHPGARTNLSWGARRRSARRLRLQHLAADRWRARA